MICTCIYVSSLHADELNLDELIKLNLVDLTKIKVTVASKREEYVSEAPAVLTIVTAQEIKNYGANNLQDILNRTASIQGIGSHFYPFSVSMRGQMLEHSNNDILFLINGRPYRTSWNGGMSERLLLGFPIDTIDRIEIIRGPGSVLYGTGAFTGVINIITKTATSLDHTRASISYGSFNTRQLNVTGGVHKAKLEVTAGLKYFDSKGWSFTAMDEANISDTVDRGEHDKGGMVSMKYGDVSIDLLYTDVKLDNLMGGPPVWPAGFHHSKHLLTDLGYQYNVDNNWKLDNHITYNKFDFTFVDTPPLENNRDSGDTLVESTLSGKLSDNVDLLVGATYETIKGTISPTINYSSYRYSGYSQLDYKIYTDLKLTAGFQWNKVEFTDGDFSPRLSLVKKFTSYWGMKLLYAEAFRSAVSTERFLMTPGVIGDPSLDPEKIATTELQIFFTKGSTFSALTIFHSDMKDVIDRIQIGGAGPLYFVNLKKVSSNGVELEEKHTFATGININGSMLYQTNEDSHGNDASLAPSFMIKVGVDYKHKSGLSAGVFDAYFDEPTPVQDVNPAVLQVNPQPKAYHLLSIKLAMSLDKFFRHSNGPNWELSLYADNLLDEDIYYPEFNRRIINSLPIHSGRAYYATLEASF